MVQADVSTAVAVGNLGGHLVLGPDHIPENVDQFENFRKACYYRGRGHEVFN